MELYTILVYLSVIVMPDGELKTYTATVNECPSTEMVMSMHQRMVDTGEIVDWAARCTRTEVQLTVPKGLKT
jgi:DNA topoisomerase VI subunit B